MYRLGIEQLSVMGLGPVEFVNLAADLGCNCISSGLTSMPDRDGRVAYSLREDKALRQEMIAALRDRGIAISLGEGCIIRVGREMRDYAADMDIMQELGVERINTVSMDPDMGRTLDQLALLAEMAGARGMLSSIELCPANTIKNLAGAVAAARHVGRKDFQLLLDTMHLGRSGARGADVAALDPALIGYVQLCDAPLKPTNPNYLEEAMFERMMPGEGGMPLREYLDAIPDGLVISLEVPSRSQAAAGVSLKDRLQKCVTAARALIAH
jgi:sugar phosphate isomerase/epimerase